MRKIRKKRLFQLEPMENEHKVYTPEPYDFCCYSELPKVLVKNDDLKYIVKHFDELCKRNYDDLCIILNYLRQNTYRIKDKAFLDKLKNSLIYNHMIYERLCVDEDDVDRLRFIIEGVAQKEGVDFFELREFSRGSYSTVYRLGNKVIKFGKRRVTGIIDNSRILIPDQILRIAGNTIEINDYVKNARTASIEDVYKVYKELREQGIVWMDPWFSNLGTLDSSVIESQREKAKNKENMPFIKENRRFKHKELKSNDYVIIDLDHFVDENDTKGIKRISNIVDEFRLDAREEFEKRYLLEKKKAIE